MYYDLILHLLQSSSLHPCLISASISHDCIFVSSLYWSMSDLCIYVWSLHLCLISASMSNLCIHVWSLHLCLISAALISLISVLHWISHAVTALSQSIDSFLIFCQKHWMSMANPIYTPQHDRHGDVVLISIWGPETQGNSIIIVIHLRLLLPRVLAWFDAPICLFLWFRFDFLHSWTIRICPILMNVRTSEAWRQCLKMPSHFKMLSVVKQLDSKKTIFWKPSPAFPFQDFDEFSERIFVLKMSNTITFCKESKETNWIWRYHHFWRCFQLWNNSKKTIFKIWDTITFPFQDFDEFIAEKNLFQRYHHFSSLSEEK